MPPFSRSIWHATFPLPKQFHFQDKRADFPQKSVEIRWFSKQICLENDSLCRVGIRYTLRKATQSLRFLSVIPACGNDWTTVFMIHKRELSDSMIESGSSLFFIHFHRHLLDYHLQNQTQFGADFLCFYCTTYAATGHFQFQLGRLNQME